jgi:hypothetical protein
MCLKRLGDFVSVPRVNFPSVHGRDDRPNVSNYSRFKFICKIAQNSIGIIFRVMYANDTK